jgi:hypothetical protein
VPSRLRLGPLRMRAVFIRSPWNLESVHKGRW